MAVVAGRRVVFTGLRVELRIRVGIRRFRRGGQLFDLRLLGVAADRTGVYLFSLGRLGGFLGHLPVAVFMELLVLHILARAFVPVVCGVVLQRVVVGGVGVGEGHLLHRAGVQIEIEAAVAHHIGGIEEQLIGHLVRSPRRDLRHIQAHAPDRIVHRPARFAGVHLLNKRALAEHVPERPLGAGDGQRAVIAALAVGGDGAGDGHIRFILIGCAVADERQLEGRLARLARVAQRDRGGEGGGHSDELFPVGVERGVPILVIGCAEVVDCAGLFVHPAGLDIAVPGEGFAAQGKVLTRSLGSRRDAALDALAAVIGDGVLRLLRRRAEGTCYLELNRHTISGCNLTRVRRPAVHGDSRRHVQTFVVQIHRDPIACTSLERFGSIHVMPQVARFFTENAFLPVKKLNIVFAEFDARDRGGKAGGDVVRRIAHLEAVDRDRDAALHLIDGVKGQVAGHNVEGVKGTIDRPGDALLPAHEFVGRAVLDLGEHESLVLQNCESIVIFCLRFRAHISVLKIQRDGVVVLRKGRHRQV